MATTITNERFGSDNGFSIYAATISITAPGGDTFTVPFNTVISAQGTYKGSGTDEIRLSDSGDTITVSADAGVEIWVYIVGT